MAQYNWRAIKNSVGSGCHGAFSNDFHISKTKRKWILECQFLLTFQEVRLWAHIGKSIWIARIQLEMMNPGMICAQLYPYNQDAFLSSLFDIGEGTKDPTSSYFEILLRVAGKLQIILVGILRDLTSHTKSHNFWPTCRNYDQGIIQHHSELGNAMALEQQNDHPIWGSVILVVWHIYIEDMVWSD